MRLVFGVAVLTASALSLAACGKKEAAKAPEAGAEPAAGAAAPAAGPVDMASIRRKPGLWKITTTAAGTTQTMRMCTDAATEAKVSVWGGQATKDMCAKEEVTRALDGSIKFSSVCDMGSGGRTTTDGVIKGDFASNYTITATTKTEGAGAPQMNGERQMTMQAQWEGPCPADFKAGDMEIAGGYRFNVLDLSAGQ